MIRKALAAATAAMLAAGSGPATAATTYFVATNGSDTANCGPTGSPCRTLQVAIDKTVAGDAVRVRAGTYNECIVVVPGSGAGGIDVVTDAFATNGTVGNVILDGAGVCDAATGAGPVAIVFDQSALRGFAV